MLGMAEWIFSSSYLETLLLFWAISEFNIQIRFVHYRSDRIQF